MTISKAEGGRRGPALGRPLGLPLWPLRKRVAAGGRRGPTPPMRGAPRDRFRRAAGHGSPALDRNVDISGIDLQAAKPAPVTFASDQARARAEKNVEHQITPAGHIPDGVGHEGGWLHSRM